MAGINKNHDEEDLIEEIEITTYDLIDNLKMSKDSMENKLRLASAGDYYKEIEAEIKDIDNTIKGLYKYIDQFSKLPCVKKLKNNCLHSMIFIERQLAETSYHADNGVTYQRYYEGRCLDCGKFITKYHNEFYDTQALINGFDYNIPYHEVKEIYKEVKMLYDEYDSQEMKEELIDQLVLKKGRS